MISKTVMCPKCKTRFDIQGTPGEKIHTKCPSCNIKGQFTFPEIKTGDSYSIEINGLTKIYKDVIAVEDLSFNVRTGEIFGFLGPNGAGKSTTIKAILNLIHINEGNIKINGFDIKKNSVESRKSLGYLPEKMAFYENLTPKQTLDFFCELRGVEKTIVKDLLEQVGLEDTINRKVGTFSKGMIQLLGIAQALIGTPSVYIMDEPMSGLDARWVKIIREKIKILNKQGATVLFSSHILSEVENICERVAIINKGKIVAVDTVENLNKYLEIKPQLEITIDGLNGKIPDNIKKISGVDNVKASDDKLYVTCETSSRSTVITAIEKNGLKIKNLKTREPSLEDAFIKLISE